MSTAVLEPRLGARPLRLAGALSPAPAVGLAAAAVALVSPFTHHVALCPFRAVTGLWCPFCGGTRAVWAAAHGDFGLMFHCNAMLPLYALVALWAWLSHLGKVTGWWRLTAPSGRAFYVAAAVGLIGFTVLRNLPWLSALAPPATV